MDLVRRYAQDANEVTKFKYLKDVWTFEDLHQGDIAPAYIHRIRNCEVKHV